MTKKAEVIPQDWFVKTCKEGYRKLLDNDPGHPMTEAMFQRLVAHLMREDGRIVPFTIPTSGLVEVSRG